jgi:hypothetical protein
MIQKIKKHSNVLIFAALVLTLSLFIIDYISLPVYGTPVLCGTRGCLCLCVDRQGSCSCIVHRNISCKCWCDNGEKDDCYV